MRIFFPCVQTEERQQLLDTWDKSLYEGVKDSDEPRRHPMDEFLALPDGIGGGQETFEAPTAEDWSRGIMPDYDEEDDSADDDAAT